MAIHCGCKLKNTNILLNFKSILQNQNAFQIFQLARYSALLLTGIILAKSGISQSEIGIYETIILLASISSFFWVNALLNIFIQRYASGNSREFTYSTTLFLLISGSVVISIIILTFKSFIEKEFTLNPNHIHLLIFLLIAQNISYLSEHIFLSTHNAKALLLLAIINFLILPLTVLVLSVTTGNIEYILIGIILFYIFKTAITLFYTRRLYVLKISRIEAINILRLSTPLSISFLLGGAAIYIDGIIVNTQYDKSTFALYQYGAREFPLAMLLATAVNMAMIQSITKSFINGITQLRNNTAFLMHKIFPLGILLMIFSPYLFPIAFNSQFSESFIYFNIYLLLIIPRMLLPQAILTALSQTKFMMRISMIEFILNISVSLILLQFLGLAGIAIGTLVAYIFEKIAFISKLNKMQIHFSTYIPQKEFCIYSTLLIITFCITTLKYIQISGN